MATRQDALGRDRSQFDRPDATDSLFEGPGEARALCRAVDWAATPLGPSQAWPLSLRTTVKNLLASRHPKFLFWGPELVQFYNDAFRPSLAGGGRHLRAIGARGKEFWTEIWDVIGPQIDQVMSGGESTWHEDHLVPIERNGRIEQVYWTYSYGPAFDDAGGVGGVLVVCQETTARVLTESRLHALNEQLETERQALAASEARLRAAAARGEQFAATLEQATDFVGIATPDGRAMFVNRAARELVGLPDDDAVHRTVILDFFPDEWKPRVRDELLPHLIRHGSWRGEVMFRHFETGEMIPVEWNAFVVQTPGAESPTALACVARDLRAEREARNERERLLREEAMARRTAEAAYAEAQAANRAKGEFLAVMSHELRTPLNAIGGYAELLALGVRGPVTELQRADLARIQQSQRHLLGLINQVLNYTRVETQTVRYEMSDVSVEEALDEAEALVEPQIRAKGLRYVQASCDPAQLVRADREKLQQILLNLLSNAIKFTESGGEIRLACEVADERVILSVADTGIGIAPEKLHNVFDPFVQVDQRLTRPNEGVGLGLAISRELARGMGGDLTADSTLGAGSTFTLTLPVA